MPSFEFTPKHDLSDFPFELSEVRLCWRGMEITVASKNTGTSLKPLLKMVARNVNHLRKLITAGTITHTDVAEKLDEYVTADEPEEDERSHWQKLIAAMASVTVLCAAGRAEAEDGVMVMLGSAEAED